MILDRRRATGRMLPQGKSEGAGVVQRHMTGNKCPRFRRPGHVIGHGAIDFICPNRTRLLACPEIFQTRRRSRHFMPRSFEEPKKDHWVTIAASSMLRPWSADNANMPSVLETAIPVSWLFSNRDSLIRLDVAEVGSVFHLRIAGPRGHRENYEFPDRHALLQFQSQCEAWLRTQGYTLAATIHERRSGVDRRRQPRRSDRRRSTVESR